MKQFAQAEQVILKRAGIPCYLEINPRVKIRFFSLTINQIIKVAEMYNTKTLVGQLVSDELSGLQIIFL